MKKTVIILPLFLSILIFQASYCSPVEDLENSMASLAISSNQAHLSKEDQFIQNTIDIIKKNYDRELIKRFIKACPSQKKLAFAAGLAPSTITKLRNPEYYGALEPSARKLWQYLQSKDISKLKEELNLTEKNINSMMRSLCQLNLSNSNIVYEELGESIIADNKMRIDTSKPYLVSDVIKYLNRMKGTFTCLNLANNLLSDEGTKAIVEELKDHELLEEINLSNNKISDLGLRNLIPLLNLPHFKKINISKNYGPSNDTLKLFEERKSNRSLEIKIR